MPQCTRHVPAQRLESGFTFSKWTSRNTSAADSAAWTGLHAADCSGVLSGIGLRGFTEAVSPHFMTNRAERGANTLTCSRRCALISNVSNNIQPQKRSVNVFKEAMRFLLSPAAISTKEAQRAGKEFYMNTWIKRALVNKRCCCKTGRIDLNQRCIKEK